MPNRLADSTSPYLRQHADNPVDWYEWGPEAFEAAESRQVPVLLSVGYSSCHWCHVMAHESFEDPETATAMNDLFVNVKVDREERPDVDAIYMTAVQALTGRGGWPMTVWLTPDGRPFYAGTYFPKTDRAGMPSFRRVMAAVDEAWQQRRDQVGEQASRLAEAISRKIPVGDGLPGTETLAAAYRAVAESYDPVNGGFGGAPKFPQQPVLDFLLHVSDRDWADRARPMLRQTLRKIARGGIRDHVGGGFARYAVDSVWLVPHFEKMLYDNAQLAHLYLRAGQLLDEPEFIDIAVETLDYLRRDLRHPEGGFYAAEDADSEGVEGRFYVWSRSGFLDALGPDDGPIMADLWGVTEDGNFEGANVLHEALTPAEVAERHGIDVQAVREIRSRARDTLLSIRSRRVRPGLDHKVVTSWNGMAVRAFAEAGAVLGRDDLVAEAEAAARFVLDRLRDGDGRLLRSWSDGAARVPGFLEDHGAMATGLFTLYQATGDTEWFHAAAELTSAIPRLFADPDGGYFTTGSDAEALITRPKDQMDNPHPSGNSLAAEALLTLSLYTGSAEWEAAAEGTVAAGTALVQQHPSAVGHLLGVLATMLAPPDEVAVVGERPDELVEVVWEAYRPHLVLAVAREQTAIDEIPLLHGRWKGGDGAAYVCRDFVCEAPVTTPEALRVALQRT